MPKRREKWARNKIAFDSIIGDPFAHPEPIEGHYATLKGRSSIIVTEKEQQGSPSPVNQARPTAIDFIIDVDSVLSDSIEVFKQGSMEKLLNTYIVEDKNLPIFNQKERNKLEQIIGNILIQRKIYPVSKYFTAIKK